jgi:outer membrane protein OmpA-like peptidoglycan-associated protein
MNAACTECGAPLSPGDAFCQKCGARQSTPTDTAPAPRFCVNCGTQLNNRVAFCTKCGTRVSGQPSTEPSPEASTPSLPPPAQAATPPPAPAATTPLSSTAASASASAAPPLGRPTNSGNLLLKAVVGVLGLFFLAGAVLIGGCVYLGYKAKQRVEKVEQAYKRNDIAGMVQAVKGNSTSPQKLPEWKPATPDLVSSPSSKIPLRVSLRLVIAGTDPLQGDYESIFVVDRVDEHEIHIKGSQEYLKPPNLESLLGRPTGNKQLAQRIKCGRTVLRADLENSAETNGYFCMPGYENKFPGTTALGFSRNTLMELKTRGEAPFTTHEDPIKAMIKSFKNAATGSGDPTEFLNRLIPVPGSPPPATPAIHCTLRRVGAGDVAVPVMVNDKQVQLPAIHAVCQNADDNVHREGYILDDPDNPLSLAGESGSEGMVQVIRINWASETNAPNPIEQELQAQGRAKIYGIYFDFASDVLRPESKTVLDEIAEVMRKHPDWKLRVEGHTDNIGGDAYNLDLSNRRAAAVKRALVSQYHIEPAKFTTAGFGASRPVATNDTMEGRALNRRVELVRE